MDEIAFNVINKILVLVRLKELVRPITKTKRTPYKHPLI